MSGYSTPAAGADEGGALELVRGAEPGLGEQPLRPDPRHAGVVVVAVERDRLQALHLDVELEVVLQVRADAGAVGDDRDAVLGEVRRRADAREHQELRRVDRGGGEDHLARGPSRSAASPRAGDLDAGGAALAR